MRIALVRDLCITCAADRQPNNLLGDSVEHVPCERCGYTGSTSSVESLALIPHPEFYQGPDFVTEEFRRSLRLHQLVEWGTSFYDGWARGFSEGRGDPLFHPAVRQYQLCSFADMRDYLITRIRHTGWPDDDALAQRAALFVTRPFRFESVSP